VESSDDAIISKTLEGVIASWNPAAERFFGYAASAAIGKRKELLIMLHAICLNWGLYSRLQR
jgi:PAS domain S-box-containing protein